MNSDLKHTARTFPDRIAELGFTAQLPADWISHDLPKEGADFTNPTLFMPLAIVTPPEKRFAPLNTSAWARVAQSTEGRDRLEAMEEELRRSMDHISVARSIAEIYQ